MMGGEACSQLQIGSEQPSGQIRALQGDEMPNSCLLEACVASGMKWSCDAADHGVSRLLLHNSEQ